MPEGVTFYFASWTFRPGDEVPPELESRLPEEVRILAANPAGAGRVRAVPEPEADGGASFSPGGRRK